MADRLAGQREQHQRDEVDEELAGSRLRRLFHSGHDIIVEVWPQPSGWKRRSTQTAHRVARDLILEQILFQRLQGLYPAKVS